ncbi:uncharacterized protein Z519_05947 [Cladophialophora bantiana CBS 173.52]|uniref:Uncharacterized protein n=1 Tax=Cladophialophora bantiana (strain ATCC 10958 / CBS 173.52 / CDC B-1940 / NIH 8579) TaxID=1442370 RepID=A0A0D2G3U3_CLAB1|nr:uncharacterized protein Z519_05947 [Cladophialophora bantiana CBS 173.52]KIW93342.1 hypothetical protein Z519_05947 [Cladophialophora bantiana CBS 173.52]
MSYLEASPQSESTRRGARRRGADSSTVPSDSEQQSAADDALWNEHDSSFTEPNLLPSSCFHRAGQLPDLQHLAVAVPELDGDSRSALLQTLWFPMVLSSPIVFQVIVLFSASHYASQRHDLTLAETILSLKQCALSGIARALSSDSRGMVFRDEMISAVAKMASYEAIFGEESAYHCHMKAVEQMLKLRGGLTTLGLEGFLSRLLVFIDTNSAFLLNTHLHFRGSSFPKLANPFIMPNPSRFVGEV